MSKPQSPATAALLHRLRAKHAGDAYAVLTEVGDSTGFDCSRWADALTMCLWPSRGLELHGYELKVSRSDWIKELKNPAKAEAVCKYCDRWWVVVGDPDIVKRDELPSTWGLIVPFKETLKVAVQAPKLEPVPLDRSFVAAIMRRAAEQTVDAAALKQARDEGFKAGEESERSLSSWNHQRNAEELTELRKAVAEFETASGVKIYQRWMNNSTQIGEAVKMVLNGEHLKDIRELGRIRRAARDILKALRPLGDDLDAQEKQGRM